MKNRLHIGEVFTLLFFAYLLLFPSQSFAAARDGFALWSGALLPTLLPFSAATLLLRETGTLSRARGLTRVLAYLFGLPECAGEAMLLGWCSGYPLGARLCAELSRAAALTPAQAQRLLALTSTANPLFLLGTVGAVFFDNPVCGLAIAIGHYAAALLPALRLRAPEHAPPPFGRTVHFPTALSAALRESAFLQLPIASSIVVASVLLSALPAPYSAWPLLRGFFEMSTGCQSAAAASLSLYTRLACCAAIVSFGGLAIHAQTLAVLGDAPLAYGRFFVHKLRQAGLAALVTRLVAPLLLRGSAPAMSAPNAAATYLWIAPAFFLFCLLASLLARARDAHRR